MGLTIDKTEIAVKNKMIDDAIVQLKKEFIGIDEQIDSIMNNVRVWFLYPQLQITPCVVNIFGMTGCGKSSLVRRISQLLDIEKNYVYFNFCAINEQSSWEIEQDIEEQLDNECSNRMFVYDEFQYAATLDMHGEEKDNKHGLKPFWELLDTGILHKRSSFWEVRDVFKVVAYMTRINTVCPMNIVNGAWVNAEECLASFTEYDKEQFERYFKFPYKKKEKDDKDMCGEFPVISESVNDEQFFLRAHVLEKFTELYRKTYNKVCDTYDVHHMMLTMSADDILDLFADVYSLAQKGYDLKFNDSIIFVIANLDEAYDVAFNVNPDMSPDQFHNITKNISIVDIKKALQKRFRNEQIARLGNIHIIYPSFTSKSFRKIIDLNLEGYKQTAKELCGLDIEFDGKIKNVIYDEAVYPTHGTRPVFSTIHEIIKTKLPHIIQNICKDGNDEKAHRVLYSYQNNKSVIKVFDEENNLIGKYSFKDKLKLNSLRASSKDEKQANTAVHESGHFVVYSYLNGRVPEKIVSQSAEKNVEGFMMRDYEDEEENVGSYTDFMNDIKVSLGGYIAEGIIFGNDRRSSGASADLETATRTASKMIRNWGMGGQAFVTSYLKNPQNGGHVINETNQEYINQQIKDIIEKCIADVTEIINKPHIMRMLKASSKYLANHSQMPKHMMVELLENAKKEGEICENNENFYRNIVNNF